MAAPHPQAAGTSVAAAAAGDDVNDAPFKIAVMTSGGDSQGMNSALRSVVKMAIQRGCHAYVIREGWEGLVAGNSEEPGSRAVGLTGEQGDPRVVTSYGYGEALREGTGGEAENGFGSTHILRVGFDDVRGFQAEGGTLIGTARCAEFRERSGRLKAARNLIIHGIDGLVVIGGDGSLTGADKLRGEWPSLVAELLKTNKITSAQSKRYAHLKIVGLVGSIDNDMALTDNTIGFTSALTRSCEALDSISSTASSHRRGFVFCCMGRHCGAIALMAAIATGSDYVFVPEAPPRSGDWREEMCEVLKKHREAGKRKTIVVIAEGAIDRDLNPISPEDVKECLTERLGLDTRVTILGHVARGGKPTAEDRILATSQGVEAVKALLEAKPETPSYIIGIREGKIVRIPLMHAVEQTQLVAKHIEAKEFDKALALRDVEFQEGLSTFKIISQIDDDNLLPKEKRLRMGLICVGAPAGGQNAAIRMASRYCIARGHEPIAIYNGFRGLLDGDVEPLSWLHVDNWAIRSGTELGTNRKTPDIDYEGVSKALEKHRIQALMIIGGFEAFMSVKLMQEQRSKYPAFELPIIQLPATLSSNVPLTESIGFSTSLNEVVNAADILRESARASRSRLFLLSCQGGKAGQLAVTAALAAGAAISYEPETGITLPQLDNDCAWLRRRFQLDPRSKTDGRLIIISDKASDAFDIDSLSRIFQQESQGMYSVRTSSLGHLCQGSVPSPLDRCRGARLAHRACEWLEQNANKKASVDTAGTMCIDSTRVHFVNTVDMSAAADFKNRRAKETPWADVKECVDLMGGRLIF